MARKVTDQVTTIGIEFCKDNFHLIRHQCPRWVKGGHPAT